MKKISYDELLKSPYSNNIDSSPQAKIDLAKKVAKLEATVQKIQEKQSEEFSEREQLKFLLNNQEKICTKKQNEILEEFDLFTGSFNKALDNMRNIILTEVNDKLERLTRNNPALVTTISNLQTTVNETENTPITHNKPKQKVKSCTSNELNKLTSLENINFENKVLNTDINFNKQKNKYYTSNNEIEPEEIENRLKKIEAFLATPLPNRDTELNSNIKKVSNIEKKIDEEFLNISNEISNIKQFIIANKNEIEEVKKMRSNKIEQFEKFHKDFLETSKNMSQLVYQNTLVVKEGNDKIKGFQSTLKQQVEEINNLKESVNNSVAEFEKKFNENLKDNRNWITTTDNQINNKQSEFERNILNQNEQFVIFIQDKLNLFVNDINNKIVELDKKVEDNQTNIIEFNQKYSDIQRIIFNNINEMEECINNKLDLVYKKLNIPI